MEHSFPVLVATTTPTQKRTVWTAVCRVPRGIIVALKVSVQCLANVIPVSGI